MANETKTRSIAGHVKHIAWRCNDSNAYSTYLSVLDAGDAWLGAQVLLAATSANRGDASDGECVSMAKDIYSDYSASGRWEPSDAMRWAQERRCRRGMLAEEVR